MQYFNRKSRELEKNLVSAVKNFHNLRWEGILGLGWAGGGKLDGAELRG
jgi:hypothetical protein